MLIIISIETPVHLLCSAYVIRYIQRAVMGYFRYQFIFFLNLKTTKLQSYIIYLYHGASWRQNTLEIIGLSLRPQPIISWVS